MIYLDNHATTRCDPKVLQAMLPYFSENYGNASSDHMFGQVARDAITKAQTQISNLISCSIDEIYFTSGATESNNLAILGSARALKSKGLRNRLVTTKIEHKSILAPFEQLEKDGWEIVFLPLDRFGQIDLQTAEEIINDDTFWYLCRLLIPKLAPFSI